MSTVSVTQAEPVAGGLRLAFADGLARELHPLWLRERCLCPTCWDEASAQRLADPCLLSFDLRVTAARAEPRRLSVTFSDGHIAEIDARLLHRELGPLKEEFPSPVLWDATLNARPEADYEAIANDAGAMRSMLEGLLRYGFSIVHNVPTAPGSIATAARLIGPIRDTNFGLLFDVRSVPKAVDLAYTGHPLNPHTDNPYREPTPGFQLLHVLVNQSDGGVSTLVDGFGAAERLRREEPALFDCLATTPTRFFYVEDDVQLENWQPIISRDAAGRYRAIRFSTKLDFVPALPRAELDTFYRARTRFDAILKDPGQELRFKLADGDLMIMDNHRTLHGRTGFTATGLRHLQGCYIDRDAVLSRFAVASRIAAMREEHQ
jgi:gamma-butyrobetaine dioxygenase